MKIALMTNNYKPFIAGVPISIERLAGGLRSLGHKVTVFAPTYREQKEEEDTFRYRSLLEGVAGSVVVPSPIDLRIEEEFKKVGYDIIHVHHPMLIGKTAVYLSRKYGIPLVFTYHTRYEQYLHYCMPQTLLMQRRFSVFAERIVARYLHSFMKNCSHVFVPTQGMQNYLTESCLYDGSVSVLPTGLDRGQFTVEEDRVREIRRKYGAEGMPLFVTVSRMAQEKNISFLLRAIQKFSEKYAYSFKVLLVGDGPCRQEYRKECVRLGIDPYVVFTGAVPNDELAAYYGAGSLFLFASKTETQGIVLLEAFAAGTPVIGVDASGVRDLVRDGENGCLTPEDADIFSDRMLIPVTDRELMEKMRRGAVQTAMQFTESEVAKLAADQYNKVVQKYRRKKEADRQEAAGWTISIVS